MSFNFMYLVSRWFLMEIDFFKLRVIYVLFLNFNFLFRNVLRGAYKSKIELNFVRKLAKG